MVFSVLQFLLSPSPPMLPSEQLYSICIINAKLGINPSLRRKTNKTVNVFWPRKHWTLPNLFFTPHGCQNSFKSSNQGVRWSRWNRVLPKRKLLDSLYWRSGFGLCLFVYFYFLFFSLPCNMLKPHSFIFNTFACCLPFWKAKKACTCLTPQSCHYTGELIGSLQLFYVAW